MQFNLDEAGRVKDSESLLQIIEETTAFLKGKGAEVKVSETPFFSQIEFENNKFSFSLHIVVPLPK